MLVFLLFSMYVIYLSYTIETVFNKWKNSKFREKRVIEEIQLFYPSSGQIAIYLEFDPEIKFELK